VKNGQIFARKSTARERPDLEYLDETSSWKVSLRERADMEQQIGRKLNTSPTTLPSNRSERFMRKFACIITSA